MRRLASVSTLVFVLIQTSCGIWPTACEFTNNGEYYCWKNEYQDFCESGGGEWYQNTSCKDLGYTNRCTSEEVAPGIQDEWTVADGCDRSEEPPPRPQNGECLVGTWDAPPNPNCGGQFTTIVFDADGTGTTFTPECTGQCSKSQNTTDLEWSTSSEFSGTLTMTYGRTVTCGVERDLPPLTVSPSFTCNDTTAVIDGVNYTRQ